MAEYTPVSKVNYNLFKQNYDPNLPYNQQSQTIQQKYNEDLFNKYSGIASEEPKLGFFDKLGSGLENLFSAYGAEKPEVPNLSYQNITPTFDLGTGITNTTAASPFKIGIEDILNQYNVPNLQNRDLVQQIIAENQAKANPFVRPNMLDISGGIVPGGITQTTPSNINLQKLNSLDFGTNYGVANTPDVIGDFLGSDVYQTDDGRAYYIDSKGEKILAPQKAEYYKQKQKPSGIEKLMSYLPFGENSIMGRLLRMGLPQESPEIKSMKNFYGSQYGLTPTGQVASGIMAGYNPVYGGALNMITGGRFGTPTQVGLAGAMQRRIENILGRKAPQTDASRAKVEELRNLQLQEMRDRADRGESLSSIGKSTFSGKGGAFEKRSGGSSGKKGTSSERNYGGR